MQDELVDPPEAAGILKAPEATLAQWRYKGTGPAYYRVGRHIRYARSDLDAYLTSVRVDPKPAA